MVDWLIIIVDFCMKHSFFIRKIFQSLDKRPTSIFKKNEDITCNFCGSKSTLKNCNEILNPLILLL